MAIPWKFLYASATGTSHDRRKEPCQDYSHGQILGIGDSTILVVVCADGAGSASRAEVGSKLACLAFLHAACKALEQNLLVADITARHIQDWYEQSRRRISLEACVTNGNLRDFACTLLTAIVSDESTVFSQIGDGVIVTRGPSGLEAVFWPQNGEYANTTYFLTDATFAERLEIRTVNGRVDELALLTDGLQPLALHYASRTVHSPFFDPMFQAVRKASRAEDLEKPLQQFLQSRPVNDRTDDDKTLLLATRRSPTDESC